MISPELWGKWDSKGIYGLWKTNVAMFKSHIFLCSTSKRKDLMEMGY